MSVPAAALAAMLVLAAAGALPVLALVGLRWVAVPLLPLGGSVIAAAAAAATVAVGGTLAVWFVALALSSGAVIVGVWLLRRPVRRSRPARVASADDRLVRLLAFAAVAAAAAWSLTALRTPSVGFDARTIWMLHARWYVLGHATSLAALRNAALPFAHTAYPPLIGGTVALSWVITGLHTDRFGVVVVALLNACAVTAAAWVLVDLGRRCRHAISVPSRSASSRSASSRSASSRSASSRRAPPVVATARRAIVPSLVGVATAALLVLVAFGVAGPFATNGYADLLWAASAVGAVGFGLVLSGRRADLGAAAVLLAVAGLTKDEGYVTAMVIVALIALRVALSTPLGETGRWWRPAVGGVAGIVGLGLWPLLTRLLNAAPNAGAPGPRDGDDASRLHASVVSMAAHLHVLLLAAPVAVVAMIVLGRARRAMGLGSDAWTWAALLAGLGAILVAYVTGPGNIELWLLTSTHRTTIDGALLGWWVVAVWAVIGSAHAVRPRGWPPGTSPRSA